MTKKETIKLMKVMRRDLIKENIFLVSWWDKQQIKTLTSAIK